MGTAAAAGGAPQKRLERAWQRARRRIKLANYVDKRVPTAPSPNGPGASDAFREQLARATRAVVRRARRRRRAKRATEVEVDLSDARLAALAPLTDHLALQDYGNGLLNTCPRLVNVVSLAEAIPIPGSGATLPLDLHAIAARCTNAYFAPKRFSAVQLAYDLPRARILIFHTGRLVQTGCAGPMEARLSVMRAVRQLQLEAGIHVRVRAFSVINQVGAASLHARLDCDRFATAHSSSAHYDRQSFVGLAWRPPAEACCCEIYATGRSNLPGSVRERDLLRSFSRMYPQLILHSDHPERIALVPPHLRDAHKPTAAAAAADAVSTGAVAPAGAWAELNVMNEDDPPLASLGADDAADDDAAAAEALLAGAGF